MPCSRTAFSALLANCALVFSITYVFSIASCYRRSRHDGPRRIRNGAINCSTECLRVTCKYKECKGERSECDAYEKHKRRKCTNVSGEYDETYHEMDDERVTKRETLTRRLRAKNSVSQCRCAIP